MKTTRAVAAGTATALGLLAAGLAVAQGDAALQVDVADCVEIESPAERFRCYESRVDSALREQSSSGEQAAPASAGSGEQTPPAPAGSGQQAPASAGSGGQETPAAAGVPASPRVSEPASPASSSASRRESAAEPVPERDIAVRGQAAALDDFGFPTAVEDDEKESEQERPGELFSTITALRETVPKSYLITLENGQVWRQKVPSSYPLRLGQEVRIYRSRFGYRLAAVDLSGFIQVERAR